MVKWKWKVWSEFQNNSWKHHIIIFLSIVRKILDGILKTNHIVTIIFNKILYLQEFGGKLKKKMLCTKYVSHLRDSSKYLSEDLPSIWWPSIKDFTLRCQDIVKKVIEISIMCSSVFVVCAIGYISLSRRKIFLQMAEEPLLF